MIIWGKEGLYGKLGWLEDEVNLIVLLNNGVFYLGFWISGICFLFLVNCFICVLFYCKCFEVGIEFYFYGFFGEKRVRLVVFRFVFVWGDL